MLWQDEINIDLLIIVVWYSRKVRSTSSVCTSPAQLLQDDEGSRMCDTWVSIQGPHAAAAPGAEPRSDDTVRSMISFTFAGYLKTVLNGVMQSTMAEQHKEVRWVCSGHCSKYLCVEAHVARTETNYYTRPVRPPCGAPASIHTNT